MDIFLEKYLILSTAINVEIGRLNALIELGLNIPAKDVTAVSARMESAVQAAVEIGK